MKQAVLTKDGFEVRNVETPVCGPTQVLVCAAGVGVCAGDVFTYRQFRQEPEDRELWPGHEASGTVARVGAQIREFAEGDRVTVLGGAFAEYCVADQAQLARVPQNVGLRSALGEPVACCVHAGWRGFHTFTPLVMGSRSWLATSANWSGFH